LLSARNVPTMPIPLSWSGRPTFPAA